MAATTRSVAAYPQKVNIGLLIEEAVRPRFVGHPFQDTIICAFACSLAQITGEGNDRVGDDDQLIWFIEAQQ